MSVKERPVAAARDRDGLLAEVADSGALVCTARFCGGSAGHMRRLAGGYRWLPVR